ncbi:transcriptional regulator family: Fungal Specific TF [Penicillium hispanicum]|uniref:transcriptional regulator family: Fungal Specific TF n=1 Tax=Penicillium hispanicum TaxID=1080232 RepID=UPI00254198E1|nr:transcriptional regulator family: Fungal Specific TF [Penicillium hispanicum]KAJ5578634.1 transcriptional regulator family: Fungal Specific TF [Penicillium hispanicum]
MERPTPVGRPYRSKVNRPCDRCRARKTACVLPKGPPCKSCFHADKECTFNLRPTPNHRSTRTERQGIIAQEAQNLERSTLPVSPRSTQSCVEPLDQTGRKLYYDRIQSWATRGSQNEEQHLPADLVSHAVSNEVLDVYTPSPDPGLSQQLGFIGDNTNPHRVQRVRSLDLIEGSIAQFYGMSAESDPWLLRHCRYDEYGMRSVNRTHYRNVGGVPVEGLVPVHFLEVEENLLRPATSSLDTRILGDLESDQAQLNDIVSPAHGIRLLALFLRFVFPSIPIISRSQLGINSSVSVAVLKRIPVHLLAAIYASAMPFTVYDAVLCVSAAYEEPLSDRLWRLAHKLIIQETHTPNLAVLQASLLYLQQFPSGGQSALPDGPFIWSFLGSTVALAVSLGLHLEPRPWGIPVWEKRLRRRLWWAVYLEDKWRSLLTGRPSFIHHEEFDVSELGSSDFIRDEAQGDGHTHPDQNCQPLFCYATGLARIRLSDEFRTSIDAARPIRAQLQNWYSSLPDSLRLNRGSAPRRNTISSREQGIADLHFSYLVVEMFLYRGILRPLAQSPPPPPIADDTSPRPINSTWSIEELTFDGHGFDQLPSLNFMELGQAEEATLNAAEKCAAIIVNFVGTLLSQDFGTFWHPWNRTCFAAVSNFVTLLLVQAPTKQHAFQSKNLLHLWSNTLRCQHRSHEGLMNLGLIRLDTLQINGLESNFILPKHVAELLMNSQYQSSGFDLDIPATTNI